MLLKTFNVYETIQVYESISSTVSFMKTTINFLQFKYLHWKIIFQIDMCCKCKIYFFWGGEWKISYW